MPLFVVGLQQREESDVGDVTFIEKNYINDCLLAISITCWLF